MTYRRDAISICQRSVGGRHFQSVEEDCCSAIYPVRSDRRSSVNPGTRLPRQIGRKLRRDSIGAASKREWLTTFRSVLLESRLRNFHKTYNSAWTIYALRRLSLAPIIMCSELWPVRKQLGTPQTCGWQNILSNLSNKQGVRWQGCLSDSCHNRAWQSKIFLTDIIYRFFCSPIIQLY